MQINHKGHRLLQDILSAQAVLSCHHQNTRTLLIIKASIICMETETVYLIIHLAIETVGFNHLRIHNG